VLVYRGVGYDDSHGPDPHDAYLYLYKNADSHIIGSKAVVFLRRNKKWEIWDAE
jgi:hypothetical protein